ncbi:hypothetical protein BDR22DRAFT_966281 [Usnea florida]
MEHTLASREAVERFADLSLDNIQSFQGGIACKILAGDNKRAKNLENAIRAESMTQKFTFKEIEERSQFLGTATIGFTVETLQRRQTTPGKAYLALQDWLSAPESRVLWLYGSSNTSKPSDLSLTSACLVSRIHDAKLPLIAHQCDNSGSNMDRLISMVYSVVIQLIWLLPEDFSIDKDLSPRGFRPLDRSVETLRYVLFFMDDLLTLAPRFLIVIVDGIQLCEDGLGRGNKEGTERYLDFFREILAHGGNARVQKTLFTTDGRCNNLVQELSPQEQIDLMSETGGPAERRLIG